MAKKNAPDAAAGAQNPPPASAPIDPVADGRVPLFPMIPLEGLVRLEVAVEIENEQGAPEYWRVDDVAPDTTAAQIEAEWGRGTYQIAAYGPGEGAAKDNRELHILQGEPQWVELVQKAREDKKRAQQPPPQPWNGYGPPPPWAAQHGQGQGQPPGAWPPYYGYGYGMPPVITVETAEGKVSVAAHLPPAEQQAAIQAETARLRERRLEDETRARKQTSETREQDWMGRLLERVLTPQGSAQITSAREQELMTTINNLTKELESTRANHRRELDDQRDRHRSEIESRSSREQSTRDTHAAALDSKQTTIDALRNQNLQLREDLLNAKLATKGGPPLDYNELIKVGGPAVGMLLAKFLNLPPLPAGAEQPAAISDGSNGAAGPVA
jgi:hypothetical protein